MPKLKFSSGFAFAIVLWLFLASGFSSLIYQVVWTRELTLVFGSTTFATATVLAVFMGGLALGSFVAGRLSDGIKRPFLAYGLLEGLIGLWALIVPALFDMAVPLYRIIWELFHLDFLTFSLLRFGVTFAVLILPTTAMGATLPLLSKFLTESLALVGRRVGAIYSVNTLGAVLGALFAGFILLPELGLTMTTRTAAGINLLLAAIVVFTFKSLESALKERKPEFVFPPLSELKAEAVKGGEPSQGKTAASTQADSGSGEPKSKKKKKKKAAAETEARPAGPQPVPSSAMPAPQAVHSSAPPSDNSLVLIACLTGIAISGGAAMVYEVCWTRLLTMVIGSSTYAFTLMLSTFLIGIFAGSFAASRFADKLKRPVLWFGILQLGVCAGCFVSMYLFQYLPWWNLLFVKQFPSDPVAILWVRFVLASMIMWPLTFNLGAIFPVVVKCCAQDLQALGRSVGTVYSANTAGAIVGSILAGFTLIPRFGVEQSVLIASAANLGVAFMLIVIAEGARKTTKVALAASGVAALLITNIAISKWDRKLILLTQAERRSLRDGYKLYSSLKDWRNAMNKREVVYWKDGPCSNVAVMYFEDANQYSLLTNGCVDASDGYDMSQQVLLAVYPMLLRPHAQTACVIGWGSGITVGELIKFPIQSITAVELEPAVITASRVFHRFNQKPEKNPRVKIEFNDGRNYLLATSRKFDIIISEPSNPWQVGVCNLFTREYFATCKNRLNPGGVLSLWLQVNEIPPETVRSIMAALQSQFKYCLAMASDPYNMSILASNEPLPINMMVVDQAFENPKLKRDLERINLNSPFAVVARIMSTPNGVSKMTENAKPNTDDLNLLEYSVGQSYETQTFIIPNAALFGMNMGVPARHIEWEGLPADTKASVMTVIAQEALKFGRPIIAYAWARASCEVKENAVARKLLNYLEAQDKKRAEFFRTQPMIKKGDGTVLTDTQTRGR